MAPGASSSPFLDACLRRPVPFTPIWLMRPAGRYMPEYRAVRARLGFLELCKSPEAAAEVTLQPVERLGVDAAILFADILLVLEPLGVGLEFTRGDGPRIERPVRTAAAARGLPRVDVDDALGFVYETVARVRTCLPVYRASITSLRWSACMSPFLCFAPSTFGSHGGVASISSMSF